MKIRFLKTVAVDVETRSGEIFDRSYDRWDEVKVAEIYDTAGYASIRTQEGEYLLNVPVSSFERLNVEKRAVSF